MKLVIFWFLVSASSVLADGHVDSPAKLELAGDKELISYPRPSLNGTTSGSLSNVDMPSPTGRDKILSLLRRLQKTVSSNSDATMQMLSFLRNTTNPAVALALQAMQLGLNTTTTSLLSDTTMVELQGWKAIPLALYFTDASYASSPRECLNAHSDFRFVSYNFQDGYCQGFSGNGLANPLITRDVGYTLLAVSRKKFAAKEGVDYPGEDIKTTGVAEESRSPVVSVNGVMIDVGSPAICMQLCRIYPRCNVATYSLKTGYCLLKSKATLNGQLNPDAISFIS